MNSNVDLNYRADIDGLRAIAILVVVCFHAFPEYMTGGFIGVDIFFVISGFLISTILYKNIEAGTFTFRDFYVRRIRRIFPSLVIVLCTCLLVGWFSLLVDEYKQLGKHVFGGASFVSNIMFWQESGYFDNATDTKPLLHLWSLGIEEQFYIVWPILLWFAWKRNLNILSITLFFAVISYVLNINEVRVDKVAVFYSPQTRFWELLIGGLLAWLMLNYSKPSIEIAKKFGNVLNLILYKKSTISGVVTISNLISFIGFLTIFYGIFRINKTVYFPGTWALLPTLSAVFIIAAGKDAWVNRIILSSKILVWIGLISYPLYLWHWPLLSFARIINAEALTLDIRFILVVVAFVLAWFTYVFVEKFFRFGGNWRFKTIFLICAMILTGAFGSAVYYKDGVDSRTIAKKGLDFFWEPSRLGLIECSDDFLLKREVGIEYCKSKSGIENIQAVIIGDSHAEDKFYGIALNDVSKNWALLGNNSCPPLLGVDVEIANVNKGCKNKFTKIVDWVVKNDKVDTVILAFWGGYFLPDKVAANHLEGWDGKDNIKFYSQSSQEKSKEFLFEYGLTNTIKALRNKKVILIVDIPELPFYPKDCFRSPYKNFCQLKQVDVELRQVKLRTMMERLKANNPNLVVYDSIDLFCNGQECNFLYGDTILYRDGHHLTLRGGDIYGNRFLKWLGNN